ncbi:unnamed protein product [Vitrella brassicaformis CCMP3155]|uniref:Uncharacterized protein n=1 Tax=Vitrella brassicaformis (strain CCMP3155) TaxID=1169540 RepID=A0A0G4FA66_VITBC|nr:unnamed protein product [Vitrella brassicaformis CCMP3155]|eukprot:CEM09867.1 unnamed protein product [Vitrella brassicaformis CCMP3155]
MKCLTFDEATKKQCETGISRCVRRVFWGAGEGEGGNGPLELECPAIKRFSVLDERQMGEAMGYLRQEGYCVIGDVMAAAMLERCREGVWDWLESTNQNLSRLTALLCLPMSYLNLNENMYIQIVTFFLQFGAIGLIIISSIIRSFQQEERTHSPVTFPPLVGDTGYGAVFGIMVASYSYVVLIPSWCNEVLPSTRVMPVVWMSAILSAFLYFSFALVVSITAGVLANYFLPAVVYLLAIARKTRTQPLPHAHEEGGSGAAATTMRAGSPTP